MVADGDNARAGAPSGPNAEDSGRAGRIEGEDATASGPAPARREQAGAPTQRRGEKAGGSEAGRRDGGGQAEHMSLTEVHARVLKKQLELLAQTGKCPPRAVARAVAGSRRRQHRRVHVNRSSTPADEAELGARDCLRTRRRAGGHSSRGHGGSNGSWCACKWCCNAHVMQNAGRRRGGPKHGQTGRAHLERATRADSTQMAPAAARRTRRGRDRTRQPKAPRQSATHKQIIIQ